MDKNELRGLSQKFLNGTASAEEQQRLNQWYDAAQAGAPEIINVEADDSEAAIQKRMYQNLHTNLFVREANEKPMSGIIKRLAIWSGSVAAVVVLLMFIWNRFTVGSAKRNTLTETHELVSTPKNRVHLALPDGSKVVLDAGAVFRYPKKFGTKNREVELVSGRAFFDIKHQTNHPFIVKTKTINVTVLGTSFDINNNVKNGTTCVSVLTGKVGVTRTNRAGTEVLMLLPSQKVLVAADTRQMKKESLQQLPAKAWYKNDYVFEQENLGNVFKMLEKEYNTHINIENKKLLGERVTVRLNNLQPLDTIMQTLSYTKHFNYHMANDSTVIIN